MADPLSITASVIAVIQITDRVITLSCNFIGKVRGAEREVNQIITTITGLKGFLEFLDKFVKDDKNAARLPHLQSLCDPAGPLDLCTGLLKDLESKMRPKRDSSGILKAVSWPWKWQHIGEALEVIERQKTLIMLAIQGDAAKSILALESHVESQFHKDILQWLTKADPFSNHMAAREKHEPKTGEWFICSKSYSQWMLSNQALWLHGIPGAGKTILCSTIIQDMTSRCSPRKPCVYFYFDFSDTQKQNVANMLSSFLAQLSATNLSTEVRRLYENCSKGTQAATVTQLTQALISVACQLDLLYVIIDALDESSEVQLLLSVIRKLRESHRVNVLLTSRMNPELQSGLVGLMDNIVSIEDKKVDADIQLHVQRCLEVDAELSAWDDELKGTMLSTLTSKAHGM